MFKVYRIFTRDKCYVGYTKNSLRKRYNEHKCWKQKHLSDPEKYRFCSSLVLFEDDLPEIEIICEAENKGVAIQLETYYINFYKNSVNICKRRST